jgi:hypothetical protein
MLPQVGTRRSTARPRPAALGSFQVDLASISAATTIVNGQTVALAQAGAKPITMVNASNQPLAEPSSIGSDGASFTVTRTSALATIGRSGRAGRRPAR